MSSLVVIPHHYLGFGYVILFFLAVFVTPVSADTSFTIHDTKFDRVVHNMAQDGEMIFSYFFFLFVISLAATCAVLPTGRYFMALGGTEILSFAFWYIIVYLIFMYRHLSMLTSEYHNMAQ
jgi:hypothetical protein